MKKISLKKQTLEPDLLKLIPARLVIHYRVLPVAKEGGTLFVAMAEPVNTKVLDELRMLLRCPVQATVVSAQELEEAIRQYYGVGAETVEAMVATAELPPAVEFTEAVADLDKIGGQASTIKFVNQLLLEAVRDRATDIHLEPYEHHLMIRYRIDGILYDVPVPPVLKQFHSEIASRIKVMSNLNVAEHRLPQDGRAKVKVGGRDLDLRISILPSPFGESVMIRLLSTNVFLGLEQLGLLPDHQGVLEGLLVKPHGIVFVSGPTGSGKTTTLYACLAKVNDRKRKMITIEDPIEYLMEGITQMQVHPKINFNFATALRSILRHDPDVIMVGEVRDSETAETAIRTALTGHLVFSTLHTNDAAGCTTRLLNMGIEPYLVASSLECAIAQRLVRLICPDCRGDGCQGCRQTGYKGRTGIFEFLILDDDIRDLIFQRAAAGQIQKLARSKGMRTLREDGMEKVRQGLTTVEEVMRVTQMEAA
ncbi:MAG: type II/IV secretion system protein [Candidatus Omnitrophica bacterium]|nr:type II/IV secretion system protein [Candidatus Omnitrophota bacterium]